MTMSKLKIINILFQLLPIRQKSSCWKSTDFLKQLKKGAYKSSLPACSFNLTSSPSRWPSIWLERLNLSREVTFFLSSSLSVFTFNCLQYQTKGSILFPRLTPSCLWRENVCLSFTPDHGLCDFLFFFYDVFFSSS